MTSQSAVSEVLVDRVSERAARQRSQTEIPLVVLEEMLTEGLHLDGESRLESAKILLVAAYRSALRSNDLSCEDTCFA